MLKQDQFFPSSNSKSPPTFNEVLSSKGDNIKSVSNWENENKEYKNLNLECSKPKLKRTKYHYPRLDSKFIDL